MSCKLPESHLLLEKQGENININIDYLNDIFFCFTNDLRNKQKLQSENIDGPKDKDYFNNWDIVIILTIERQTSS